MCLRGQLGDYTLHSEVLGEGAFGEVRLGLHVLSNELVAIKQVVRKKLSPQMLQQHQREAEILNTCKHEGIVKLWEIIETTEEFLFVFEYANEGDLYDFVCKNERLGEDLARALFAQIVHAVQFLHSHNCIHHDIKLENILLHRSSEGAPLIARISDFGLACLINKPGEYLMKFSGTEAYSSPEILEGRPYDGSKSDIYALGVLLYICITGQYPFDEDLDKQIQQQTSHAYLGSLYFPDGITTECKELILAMLEPNAMKRPGIDAILSHSFMLKAGPQQPQTTSSGTSLVVEECLPGTSKREHT